MNKKLTADLPVSVPQQTDEGRQETAKLISGNRKEIQISLDLRPSSTWFGWLTNRAHCIALHFLSALCNSNFSASQFIN